MDIFGDMFDGGHRRKLKTAYKPRRGRMAKTKSRTRARIQPASKKRILMEKLRKRKIAEKKVREMKKRRLEMRKKEIKRKKLLAIKARREKLRRIKKMKEETRKKMMERKAFFGEKSKKRGTTKLTKSIIHFGLPRIFGISKEKSERRIKRTDKSERKNVPEETKKLKKEILVKKPRALSAKEKIKVDKSLKKVSEKKIEKIRTDIPGLDVLLRDGIPEGSSVLVEGGPGSGKTIFCLQLAHNMCKRGKRVLYMSFEEPEHRLIDHMKSFGWNVDSYISKGQLMISRFDALDVARSVEALLSEAKKELLIDVQPMLFPEDFQPDVVLIDSLTSISSAFSGEESRFRIYMEQLFRYLEKYNITSFLIREVANPTHTGYVYVEHGEAVSFLSDGIIVLYNVIFGNGRRKSAIEILKLRGSHIDRRIVEMEIKNKKGIIVYPNKELKGVYHLT